MNAASAQMRNSTPHSIVFLRKAAPGGEEEPLMRTLAIICLGLGLLAATPAIAEPANDVATLHPGHQGHLKSGKFYPGVPATEFHEVEAYETGPGGWAEQKSNGANDQRAVD
jgi:hypothetical protein